MLGDTVTIRVGIKYIQMTIIKITKRWVVFNCDGDTVIAPTLWG